MLQKVIKTTSLQKHKISYENEKQFLIIEINSENKSRCLNVKNTNQHSTTRNSKRRNQQSRNKVQMTKISEEVRRLFKKYIVFNVFFFQI